MRRAVLFGCALIILSAASSAMSGEAARPKVPVVPFGDGYCSVSGPLFIMAKAGAKFEFGPKVEFEGKSFQIQKPLGTNSYVTSSVTVRPVTKVGDPVGSEKKLNCSMQEWDEKQQTVDFVYADDAMQVIVHVYMRAMGGFVIKDVECQQVKSAR